VHAALPLSFDGTPSLARCRDNNSIKVYKKVNKFYEKKKYSFFVLAPQGKKVRSP